MSKLCMSVWRTQFGQLSVLARVHILVMADTTGITKQHKLEFVIMYIYYLPAVPHILAYVGHARTHILLPTTIGKIASKQQIKASKYHMRALGTASPNSNTINIILHNNSYLPAVQWPKWQQISKHQNFI